jgi:hypothetical protein
MYSVKFPAMAQRLIKKFTAGTHIFKKFLSESYNTTTGVITAVYDDNFPVDMTQEDAKNTFEKEMYKGSVLFTVSSLDLEDVIPENGDVVVNPDGESFKVIGVRYDQYKSRYVLGTEKII